MKEKDVILPFAILMTSNFTLMLCWTLIDPLIWIRTEPNDAYESHGYCHAEGGSYVAFLVSIAIVNALALALANVQAFRARNTDTEFSESLYVSIIMLSLLECLIIGIPLLVLVHDIPVASYFVWSGLIFIVTMATLGLMFVPKMFLLRRRASETTRSASRNLPQSTLTSTENPNMTSDRPSGAGQAPDTVIVLFQNDLQSGNRTVMTGQF